MMTLSESARAFLSAWKFMWATPKRRLLILAPVILNGLLWVSVIPVCFLLVRWITVVSLPDTWWATVLAVFTGLFAVAGVIMLAVVVFVALTTVIGAPFYGALAEEIMEASQVTWKEVPWYREIQKAISFALKLGVVFVCVQIGLLALNIVPILGTALHLVGGFTVTILLLALEFFGEVFEKNGYAFRARILFLFRHHQSIIAFGVPVFVLLFVPVLNLFVPPLATVTASRLFCDILVKNKPHQKNETYDVLGT